MLNPELDIAALAAAFAAPRRLVVPDVFEPEYAARIHAGLAGDVPWRLSFRDNRLPGKAAQKSLSREEFAALGRGGAQAVRNTVMQQAADGFQYLFSHNFLTDSGGRAGWRRVGAPAASR